jgi:hypothetical protein
MAKKVQACDLELDADYLKQHIRPDPSGVLRDSMTLFYRVLGSGDRTIPTGAKYRQKIHKSAIDRMGRPSLKYKPDNLVAYRKSPEFQVTD